MKERLSCASPPLGVAVALPCPRPCARHLLQPLSLRRSGGLAPRTHDHVGSRRKDVRRSSSHRLTRGLLHIAHVLPLSRSFRDTLPRSLRVSGVRVCCVAVRCLQGLVASLAVHGVRATLQVVRAALPSVSGATTPALMRSRWLVFPRGLLDRDETGDRSTEAGRPLPARPSIAGGRARLPARRGGSTKVHACRMP